MTTCRTIGIRVALGVATVSALAVAQTQFAELSTKRHLPLSADYLWPFAVAAGDIDGDGDIDVVMGWWGLKRMFLNDGAGRFQSAAPACLPADEEFTNSLAFADVDGDGDLDLLIANGINQIPHPPQNNKLYLNDGTGSFTSGPANLPIDDNRSESLAVGDVDNDGDLDVVFGSFSQNLLYLNDGTGVFRDATAQLPPDSSYSNDVALEDVDGDGDRDLIVCNIYDQNRLLLNDGSGSFTDVSSSHMPQERLPDIRMAVGDVDGDGDVDLAFGAYRDSPQNRLYLNDGTGRFTDWTSTRMPVDSDDTFAIDLADVDRDGDLDMVLGNVSRSWNGTAQDKLYLNDGSGTFVDRTSAWMPVDSDQAADLVMADVDGDSDLDLIISGKLHLNYRSTRFIGASVSRLPFTVGDASAYAFGDVDGDGSLDLFVGNLPGISSLGPYYPQNRLFLNDGSGTFTDVTLSNLPIRVDWTRGAALGDVDGDGDLDLVIANGKDEINGVGTQSALYLNVGAGQFTDVTSTHFPVALDFGNAVALGDVDGDGDLDAVLGTGDQRQNRQDLLYLNDGTGRFSDQTGIRLPSVQDYTIAVALCDLDGDNDLDLFCCEGNRGRHRLYLNDGTGRFGAPSWLPVGMSDLTNAMALADVDGDGDLDAVLANSGLNRIYLNNGSAIFYYGLNRLPVDADYSHGVALGDVDGDGDLDIVFANGISHFRPELTRLYLNDGTGTFFDATKPRLGPVASAQGPAAMADVDNDGDPEILLSTSTGNLLLTNLHRQLASPYRPAPGRSLELELYAEPGYGTSMQVVIPLLQLALAPAPLVVPGIGTLYLNPTGIATLPIVKIKSRRGVATITIPVPANASLIGGTVFTQALVFDPASPVGRLTLTGYVGDLIID